MPSLKTKIMVIDDDQDMLRLINRTLELEGFNTLMMTDGSKALRLLDKTNPDLIILDIMMPGLDGFQTLRLIREQSNVPVIILSALSEMESLQQSFFLGADDFVTKPFMPQSFVARIRAKLRRARKKSLFSQVEGLNTAA